MMQNIKRLFGLNLYHPLNVIELTQRNLLQNYKYLSSLNKNTKIAPVLKSNAYGHGILEVGKILDKVNAPFFCVDSLYEAYQLFRANIKTPILIMGYIDPKNLQVKKLPFKYAVFDLDLAKAINKYQPAAKVHIFVDTGMNREGIRLNDLPQFLKELKKFKNIKIEGLMSHLASDSKKQFNNFLYARKIIEREGIKTMWLHILNTQGLLYTSDVSSNLARVGLALYGIDSPGKHPKLKPVLSFKTKLIQIKKIKKGERVGYGGTFKASHESIIGILPAGYNDGVDRRLSNKGVATIDKVECPIAGKVSMNITTIDISKVKNPKLGQELTIYSDHPKDVNSLENCAKICDTIPYDLLVKLHPSTKRIIV